MEKENLEDQKTKTKRENEKSKKRQNLKKENKRWRKELKRKRKELEEHENIDERISNIYDVDTQKGANRRFNTIYNQLNQFNEDTQKFLKNLNKKIRQNHHILQKRTNTSNKQQNRRILQNNPTTTHEKNIPHTIRINTMDQTTKNQMDKKKCSEPETKKYFTKRK